MTKYLNPFYWEDFFNYSSLPFFAASVITGLMIILTITIGAFVFWSFSYVALRLLISGIIFLYLPNFFVFFKSLKNGQN